MDRLEAPPKVLSTISDNDKTLLSLFIAFHVLAKLGFSEERISQCLVNIGGEGWEAGLEWVSLIHFNVPTACPDVAAPE